MTHVQEFLKEPEELYVGGCFGLAWVAIVGWWFIPLAAITALLWKLGGWRYGHKLFRRVGVPVVTVGAMYLSGNGAWYTPASGLALYGVLTLGYGMPDATDSGSPLGRFWSRECTDTLLAASLTRLTVSLLAVACFAQLAIRHPFEYTGAVLIFAIGHVLVERWV